MARKGITHEMTSHKQPFAEPLARPKSCSAFGTSTYRIGVIARFL